MIVGSIWTALADVEPNDVERATELIGIATERVLEHLRLAVEMSGRQS